MHLWRRAPTLPRDALTKKKHISLSLSLSVRPNTHTPTHAHAHTHTLLVGYVYPHDRLIVSFWTRSDSIAAAAGDSWSVCAAVCMYYWMLAS